VGRDGLGERVQHRPVVHAEHVPADDRRPARQVGEGRRAQDALGVELHVVVHDEQVIAPAGAQRLIHRAGEPAGAAEVSLLDHLQPVAELLGRVGEARMVLGPARAWSMT
jgi:hypothetical protein